MASETIINGVAGGIAWSGTSSTNVDTRADTTVTNSSTSSPIYYWVGAAARSTFTTSHLFSQATRTTVHNLSESSSGGPEITLTIAGTGDNDPGT